MSNILGIICEYNPFHNGHLYHLNEAKRLTNSDYSVAVISGNFSQRGDPAIVSKWVKTEMALKCGVDLVLELPTIYSISSAENFAYGAIKILDSLNLVDYLCFGSECGDISILDDIVQVLVEEPKAYRTLLSHELSTGVSFPKAREKALMMYLGNMRRFANVLSSPNNILGIEYLKTLKKQDSFIQPVTIKRQEAEHNNNIFSSSSRFASGSAIRSACISPNIDQLQKYMPEDSFYLLEDCLKKGNYVKDLSAFDKEILYTLRRMTIADIANLPDVSEGLEYAIKDAANSCNSVVELLTLIDTKRYTKTRLQRILLYAILGITKDDMQLSKKVAPYIRILGFNENGKKIISEASRRNPKLNLITSPKKFMDGSSNKNLKHLLQKDIWASNVYTLGFEYESKSNLDYTHKLIIV